jgi:hypothetical protein
MAKDKSKMGTAEMCFLFCECNCCSAVADTELPPPASQLQAVTSPLAAQGDVRTALLICMAFRISSPPQPLAFSASELNSLSPTHRPTQTSVFLISSVAHSKRPSRTHPAALVCSSCHLPRHGYARSRRARRPGSRRCSDPSRRLCRY